MTASDIGGSGSGGSGSRSGGSGPVGGALTRKTGCFVDVVRVCHELNDGVVAVGEPVISAYHTIMKVLLKEQELVFG